MLWKRLYKDNIWANNVDELAGLSSDMSLLRSFCDLAMRIGFHLCVHSFRFEQRSQEND